MHLIAEHLRATELGLVIWLAYGTKLCEQAAAEFERAWCHPSAQGKEVRT